MEEKIVKQEKQKKKPKYVMFILFFFFFIGGYLFFFTSMFWMPDEGIAKRKTELHKEVEWNQRAVSLLRWDYSEQQRLMEVELQIVNKEFDSDSAYVFSALEVSGKRMKVEAVLSDPDWIILQIKDVPKRFREVSLHMEMEHDENAGILRFYTNKNDVKKVPEIRKKTQKEYMIARLDETINGYRLEIKNVEKQIETEEIYIQDVKEEIYRLGTKKPYQTEEEIKETDRLIQDANINIENAEDKIKQSKELIKEYNARIEKTTEKKEQIQLGL